MAANTADIYQFKITLKYITPKIWRRIQVPGNYNFWDLHVAIVNVMKWKDYHLHQFDIVNPETSKRVVISAPANGNQFQAVIDEHKANIAEYFSVPKKKAVYEYDFGDGWQHEIILEKIFKAVEGVAYPQCIAGARACPPEDCGGVPGYGYLLEILSDPEHEEYAERIEWLGGGFNPEEFDPKLVQFDDPEEHCNVASG